MRIRQVVVAVMTVAILPYAAGDASQSPATRQPSFPSELERYLTSDVRLTSAQRRALLSGAPVTTLLAANASQEVAVFGAIWIDALPSDYVRLLNDIEQFERGGAFRVTKRISSPPRLEDFAALELPQEDVADLRSCRVGACEIKLSQSALDRVRSEIDWSKPTARAEATALARRLALEYVTGYVEGGNSRLAVYRDAARPTFVADEFASMVERLPALVEYLPELRAIAVASKLLYASQYFWTALELRVLVSDPARGRGFWFVTVSYARVLRTRRTSRPRDDAEVHAPESSGAGRGDSAVGRTRSA